jgi:hypothetical protein
LAVALYSFRNAIFERWHIWRLDSDVSSVREQAARALGELGRNTDKTLDALRKALEDSNEGVRKRAAWAFSRILGLDSGAVELISEYDAVVVGAVGTVEPSALPAPTLEDWRVVVNTGEVLKGSEFNWGKSFFFYCHSPSLDLGINVNNPPKEPWAWLMKAQGTKIEEFCRRLDPRYRPEDVESFRKAVEMLNKYGGGDRT